MKSGANVTDHFAGPELRAELADSVVSFDRARIAITLRKLQSSTLRCPVGLRLAPFSSHCVIRSDCCALANGPPIFSDS